MTSSNNRYLVMTWAHTPDMWSEYHPPLPTPGRTLMDRNSLTWSCAHSPRLDNAQAQYWGSNLPRLEQIKKAIDPNDIFHNPQSVRPAA